MAQLQTIGKSLQTILKNVRKRIWGISRIRKVTFLVYCKNVITFERFNYKRSENYHKQLQTILNQDV